MLKHNYLSTGLFSLAILSSSYTTQAFADSKQIEQGEALYNQNCQMCHQPDAIGKPGFAPSLTNRELLSIASDKFFLSTIRDGRMGTGMPPMAHLGKEKITAIVAYLRSHAKLPDRSAKVDAQPKATGNKNNGQELFAQICAGCHGTDGQGYAAGVAGTAIGKSGFLNKVSDGFIRTMIKEGRSNTRMRGFSGSGGLANLTDSEIDDVIIYLRALN
ncbi:MAG: c-type cytochrome [Gammaproteobacteria bacterium]|nr:c-type cytochrome [Gammaproteobacteria bacterium]